MQIDNRFFKFFLSAFYYLCLFIKDSRTCIYRSYLHYSILYFLDSFFFIHCLMITNFSSNCHWGEGIIS